MPDVPLVPYGLVTNPNTIAEQKGAMAIAENVVARRPGVLQSRPGTEYHSYVGAAEGELHRVHIDGSTLYMSIASSLYKYSGGNWSTLIDTELGQFTPGSPLQKAKARRLAGNLYFSGYYGLKRLATDENGNTVLRYAGSHPALGFDLDGPANVLTGTGGFLADGYQCAYRMVMVDVDSDGRFFFGAPSSRTIVANATFTTGYAAGVAKNVVLRARLDTIFAKLGCFFQVYRSKAVPVGQPCDDDLQLVYQDYITTQNLSDNYVEFTDSYSETVPKGAFIHTAPNGGTPIGAIDGENMPPPASYDGGFYKSRHFLFGLMYPRSFEFTILAVGGTNGIQANDTFQVASNTFTAVAGAPAANQFRLTTTGTATQNIEMTAQSLVMAINKANLTSVRAAYISSPDGIPGRIRIESKRPNWTSWFVEVGTGSKRTCYDPVLYATGATVSLTRVGTTVTATFSAAHSYRVGEQVLISGASGGLSNGTFTITAVPLATTLTYTDGSGAAGPVAGVSISLVSQSAYLRLGKPNDALGGFAYSKPNEVEAFPRRNQGAIGSESTLFRRAAFLRDSVMLFCNDGLYRLTGDDPQTFAARLVNGSLRLLSSESVCILDDKAYAATSQGIIECGEDGWSNISEEDIAPTYRSIVKTATLDVLERRAFMVAHPEDKTIEWWYPANSSAVRCVDALVFNTQTRRWSTRTQNIGMETASYSDAEQRRFYASTQYYSGGTGWSLVFKDRRDLVSTDFRDATVVDATPTPPTMSTAAFRKRLKWQPRRGSAVEKTKKWTEASFAFEETFPTTLTVLAENEFGHGSAQDIANVGMLIGRLYLPFTCEGTRLDITISAEVSQEAFTFVGGKVFYRALGLASRGTS